MFFGTLYHLRHPLLGLEKLAAVCDGDIYVESAVCDDYSPHRGGFGRGFPNRELVMEFYPGDQYGGNHSNWWAPTLQCLGSMLNSVGFRGVDAWALTDDPKELAVCRGFAYGTKRDVPVAEAAPYRRPPKVSAVMSVPRLGFIDNFASILEGILPLGISPMLCQGAYWAQSLENGMVSQVKAGADAILTIDYDSVFSKADVRELIRLLDEHPEAAAIVPVQAGRIAGNLPLATIRGGDGKLLASVPRDAFLPELTPITTGHFGFTLIRTAALQAIPHPWLHGRPNEKGEWGDGRVDDDISFWYLLEKHGLRVYLANRIVVGHLELMAMWPDGDFKPTYTKASAGKPANAWK
jgi:hypothetical protein